LGLLALQVAANPLWRPGERVVLGDYAHVRALAATPFRLYIATPGGLAIWDRTARRFDPPSSRLDGYPTAPVVVALAAPDETLWLGTAAGWARYEPSLRRWEGGLIAGGVRDLALDPNDVQAGVYLRTSREWLYLPWGAFAPVPGRRPPAGALRPLSVDDALREEPAVDAMQSLLLADETLRSYPPVAAARSPDQPELFLGTNGGGVVAVDVTMLRSERLAFGLPGSSVAAVAPASGGVWTLLDQRGGFSRRGFAQIGRELATFRWFEGRSGLPFGRGRAVVAHGGVVWGATDGGLLRLTPESADIRVLREVDGLPSGDVWALASTRFGLAVGTRRGLAVVPQGATAPEPLGTTGGDAVLALHAHGDTLWVGLERGLGIVPSDRLEVLVPPGSRDLPSLRAPIVALTSVGDTVVAATNRALYWRDPATGSWQAAASVPLSAVEQLTSDDHGVWVTGPDGVAYGSLRGEWWARLAPPGDLPGRPTGVATGTRWIWVATERGLVRFARGAIADR
jgi:ligand-binding sensor domain-containing protein